MVTQELCQVAEDGARTCLQLADGILLMGPALTGGSTEEGFLAVLGAYLAGFGTGMVKRIFLEG